MNNIVPTIICVDNKRLEKSLFGPLSHYENNNDNDGRAQTKKEQMIILQHFAQSETMVSFLNYLASLGKKPRTIDSLYCSIIKTHCNYNSSYRPLIINIADHKKEMSIALLLFEITRYYLYSLKMSSNHNINTMTKEYINKRDSSYGLLIEKYHGEEGSKIDELINQEIIPGTSTTLSRYYNKSLNIWFKKLYIYNSKEFNYENPYPNKENIISVWHDQWPMITKALQCRPYIIQMLGNRCHLPNSIDFDLIAINKTFYGLSIPLIVCTRIPHKERIPFIVLEEMLHHSFAHSHKDFQNIGKIYQKKYPHSITTSNFHHFLIYYALLSIAHHYDIFNDQQSFIIGLAKKEGYYDILQQYIGKTLII
ncbi:MAG TPA: hypothetical protein PLW93_03230 [Candidatus Absconditabacterales bacterium]|nr:hypothetical protein [Candidatus Absconditabacterales bacterium]HNG97262.1 hypothetical protein [Candidatus Absconditabacterales bacterium]